MSWAPIFFCCPLSLFWLSLVRLWCCLLSVSCCWCWLVCCRLHDVGAGTNEEERMVLRQCQHRDAAGLSPLPGTARRSFGGADRTDLRLLVRADEKAVAHHRRPHPDGHGCAANARLTITPPCRRR